MKIKVLFKDKRGKTSLYFMKNFDFVRRLVEKYPNAIWRKCPSKNDNLIIYEMKEL